MARAVLLASIIVFAVAGCEQAPAGAPTVAEAGRESTSTTNTPLLIPKDLVEAEALGIPVMPGSALAEGKEGLQIETKVFDTTVRVKFYAPEGVGAVAKFMLAGAPNLVGTGSADMQMLRGKSKRGDDIDVRLGAAADKKRTVVMAWITRAN